MLKKKKEESAWTKNVSHGLLFERNDIDVDYEEEMDVLGGGSLVDGGDSNTDNARKQMNNNGFVDDEWMDHLSTTAAVSTTGLVSTRESTSGGGPTVRKYVLDPSLPPEIKHLDFAFLLQSIEKCREDDYMLKTIVDSEAIKCHLYTEKFDLGHLETRQMIMLRTVGILPYQLCDVVNSTLDIHLPQGLTEVNADVGKVITMTSVAASATTPSAIKSTGAVSPREQEYSVSVSRRTVSHKGLSKQLDYCLAGSVAYDVLANKFLIVHKSCNDPRVKPIAKSIRSYTFNGTVFEALKPTQKSSAPAQPDNTSFMTKYTSIQFVKLSDFGGKKKNIRVAYETHAVDLYNDLLTKCHVNHIKGFPPPKKIGNLYQTLLDFEKNQFDKCLEFKRNPWRHTAEYETLI
jgi:hypothetical protein